VSLVSPRAVLARIAEQVPPDCRDNLIVVGSLAAAYHLLDEGADLVRTKDVDCLLVPRVEAVRAGTTVAEALLEAGWRPQTEGPHGRPGSEATGDADLPVVRLFAPESTDWYIELLTVLDASDPRDRAFERVVLGGGEHYALASCRYLDVVAHDPTDTPAGLRCARLAMLVPSNLLRNPTIRPDRMQAAAGLGPRRSNKDLGRVLTISRLAGRDVVQAWPAAWAAALQARYGERWQELGRQVGAGIRALLRSEGDLQEALDLSRLGLLAQVPMAPDEFRIVGERLLVDAIEPFEADLDAG